MVSEVNGPTDGAIRVLSNRAGKPQPTNSAGTQAKGHNAADSVSLTDVAAKLQALEKAVAASSGVDPGRVEALRQAIRSGDYEIDPQQIAEKLLDLEAKLPPVGDEQ